MIREPWLDDKSKDQKYEVSNIDVDSPTGAPDEFDTETTKQNGDRDQILRIKIGEEDKTVRGVEATYVITYDVRGALRHFDDHSELYWDATGSAWEAPIKQVTINVAVPQGVQQVDCFTGRGGSTVKCPQSSIAAGKGVFQASGLAQGEQLTIVAGIKAGAVQNDTPIVVDPPDWLQRNGLNSPGADRVRRRQPVRADRRRALREDRQQGPAVRRDAAGDVPAGRDGAPYRRRTRSTTTSSRSRSRHRGSRSPKRAC